MRAGLECRLALKESELSGHLFCTCTVLNLLSTDACRSPSVDDVRNGLCPGQDRAPPARAGYVPPDL